MISFLKRFLNNKSTLGFLIGLCLYGSEATLAVFMIPFYKLRLGDQSTIVWVTLTTSVGLVSFAYSSYYQPMIRNLSQHFEIVSAKSIPKNLQKLVTDNNILGYKILFFSQVFFLFFFLSRITFDTLTLLGIVIYLGSLFYRLSAFNNFIILNGLRQVGDDKKILFYGSILGLFLSVIFLIILGHIIGLAISSFISAFYIYSLSQKTKTKYINQILIFDSEVIILSQKEKKILLMLNLGGYLKLNTDIIVASSLIPEKFSLDYAFWIKVFFMVLSLLSLWTQIRFPFWASNQFNKNKFLREVNFVVFIYFVVLVLVVIAFSIFKKIDFFYFKNMMDISIYYVIAMAASVFLAGYTYALDQFLMAKKCYSLIKTTVILSLLAPVFSFLFASVTNPFFFIFGYMTVHLLLLVVDFLRFRILSHL